MKRLCKLFVLLCAVLLLTPVLRVTAAEIPTITIHYKPGVCEFAFYRIADASETTGLKLVAPFSGYTGSVSSLKTIESLDGEGLRVLASTLESIIDRDGIKPAYRACTDEKGDLTQTVTKGLYLIIGQTTRDDTYRYTPSPVFVTVPNRPEGGQWSYSITLNHGKFEKEPHGDETTDLTVMKIWNDSGNNPLRPTSIRARLLRDGVEYETVTLGPGNNWSYTWRDLPAGHRWSVAELDIPTNYYVTTERDGRVFVIRNTYEKPPPPPPDLPQTGQLWWPVPILAALGLAALVIGCLQRRDRRLWQEL